ncbi:unnamed protein product [Enterobius vermicularis]|uniref:ANK_REP_REGION domain-containing protein n=1 Tax=Enterobius vermicularis TaxID=51028 RepID=A0A0N4UXU2_ENTVE|nr:unnamed protein product [Enterobius vermicularis]
MKDKRTVAHVAAMYANDEMVDVLIKKGIKLLSIMPVDEIRLELVVLSVSC